MMLGKGNVDFAGVLRIVHEIVAVAVTAAFAQWLLSVCNNRITFAVSRDLRERRHARRSRPCPSPTSTATPPATS